MLKKILSHLSLSLLLSLSVLPWGVSAQSVPDGLNAGPDIITGNITSMDQFGSTGSQVGLGVSTTSCNAGNVSVDFFPLPETNHPVILLNLYRKSGGSNNDDHFEQIGQSWVKHTFASSNSSECGFCTPAAGFHHLGAGCSDTYLAHQSAIQTDLGSRALINPFTGVFQSTASDHTGHVHTGTSHRLLVEASDLNTTLNPGATYYVEVQYVAPDEYAWCQTHPGECNMYNNASYCRFSVNGTTTFTFAAVPPAVRSSAAINAWPGATILPIEPAPGTDGRAFIAYKVTNPSAGLWHYEYAIYNENLDRAIQSFGLPGCGVTVSNLGFHAPPNHPGFPNDGTQGGAGFSNAAWVLSQTSNALTWSTETFAQDPNANAIRWGTTYNFRFDSNLPPVATNATIGFFKTGTPITVGIMGPLQDPGACNGTPTPTPAAQAINLSTRMRVQTGENVGIGGFILSGTAPKHLLIRAIGPSLTQFGVLDVLADPVLELRNSGSPPFATIINDNWRDFQEAAILATGLAPTNNLEPAIDATLHPGAYTAVLSGKNNTTGVALVEVYDLSAAVPAKLANISTRAFVSTGNDIVIAGFILGHNSGNDRIVVRGIGPSLATLGVTTALANPTLQLCDSNGAVLVANNDWQDVPAQAAELTAAGLAPTNLLESGIAATLPPGLYTALLTEVNNGAGVGVIEVYDRGAP